MVDKAQLIENLIRELDQLDFADRGKLDGLQQNADMIIRKIFGDASEYRRILFTIPFSLAYDKVIGRGTVEGMSERSWNQGIIQTRNLFNTMLQEVQIFDSGLVLNADQKPPTLLSTKRIFVVHGHDEEMKQSVARALTKLGLDPVILHEQPNRGRTIIEKFSDHSSVSFAIVLLSPDDIAYCKDEPPENAKPRARQNVIFELGFFIAKLGRERVFVLRRGEELEIPSDYQGILYVPYDGGLGQWRFDLVRELNATGYEVDANILL